MSFAPLPEEQPVCERLGRLGIPFERFEHPPAARVEDAQPNWAGIEAMHCKNLFLRNQKGSRHYLLITVATKRVDLRAVAAAIGDGKLSFGSPERLKTCLGVTPGSVSPFGLIHDTERQVRVYLDRDLGQLPRISFHPNINTLTYVLAFDDFQAFLKDCGSEVRTIEVVNSVA
ncbi:MAG: prolyl-tRNA synthetase associated domain-containing protein [Vicinamibacterales bacterium]